jgi:hypothetical protein
MTTTTHNGPVGETEERELPCDVCALRIQSMPADGAKTNNLRGDVVHIQEVFQQEADWTVVLLFHPHLSTIGVFRN